ncbi:MAG: response regulator [Rhodospirillaceae bacterium]
MTMIVVVVEDDHKIRAALKLVLNGAGYMVIDGSGLEVVSAMVSLRKSSNNIRISAVVTDFWLDLGITGIHIILCLRKICNSDFRSVVISGDTNQYVIEKVRSAGLTLLYKPFTLTDILEAVEPAHGLWHAPGGSKLLN